MEKETTMKVQEISLNLIKENPYQTREEIKKDPLKVLTRSIQERGLLSPIQLLKDGESYIIICGHRRLEAFKSLKKKTIPAIIKSRGKSNELIIDLVHENLVREDLTPIEKGLSIRLLLAQIKHTSNDIDKMYSLINSLKNYKNRGYIPEHKKERTKCFDDMDIFRLDKILKSIGISENNAVTYLLILKLPPQMRKALVFNKRGIIAEGKIVVKQAEQLVRVKDPKYQEYLFNKCLDGCSVKVTQALVNEHIKKVERGEWKGFTKKTYHHAGKFKDDIQKMEFLSSECKRISARICSFKVDTLLKLEETMEKEEFISSMVDLKKQLELLNGRIEEKLKDKGYKPIKKEVDPFEVVFNFSEKKHHFRYTFPMKIIKALGLTDKKKIFAKLKIVGIRE